MRTQFNTTRKGNKGFALLFTVLIISLILSIALSISSLTLKQAVLSSLAKDSQIAFYQADTAIECGLYEDGALNAFPAGSAPDTVPQTFTCGSKILTLNTAQSGPDYFVYQTISASSNLPCFGIVFDKTSPDGSFTSKIQGYGYNTCTEGPRQVERALEVTY